MRIDQGTSEAAEGERSRSFITASEESRFWTEKATGRLLGCGIDAEATHRFRDDSGELIDPWSTIFTKREISHALALPDPAVGICASFCSKEALIKALGTSIDYHHCELLFSIDRSSQELLLSPTLCDEHGVVHWKTYVEVVDRLTKKDEECQAVVVLYSGA